MAEQNVVLLTMRRPGLAGGPRDEGVGPLTRPEGDGAGLWETRESLLEGGAVDVDSFPDAVRVAAVFYGQEDTDALVVVHVGGGRVVHWFPGQEGEAHVAGARVKGKMRHPLLASLLGTLRIMWFAVRHPGKSAWIDHDTGEVWVADRTV